MKCNCCNSSKIKGSKLFSGNFSYCIRCGLLFKKITNPGNFKKDIVSHYHDNDPRQAIALSKKIFFNSTLEYLLSNSKRGGEKVLDVGCGRGYFLKMLAKSGFEPNGVELARNETVAAKLEFGPDKIFHGELTGAAFADDHFDAITLWDVLVMIENPYKEIKECHRISRKDGIIGIRVRNVVFQKIAYYIQKPFKKIYRKLGIKHPSVFHPFNFTPRSIVQLLNKSGFTEIRILNSPLTSGDPYGYWSFQFPTQVIKTLIQLISILIFSVSRGRRWIIGPSLLVWAKKPDK